jgi:hypothetical protein
MLLYVPPFNRGVKFVLGGLRRSLRALLPSRS